jgi:outer membrane lipoprotein-sorting protein
MKANATRDHLPARRVVQTCMATSILLGCAIAAAQAATFDVATLFDSLAKERPAHAQFHERKYLSLLAQPVESSGELSFTPPNHLEKRTISPKPETIVVDDKQLVIERGGKRQTLELAQNTGVAALITSIRSTLAGDLASLSREYSIQLDGDASVWHLVLRPLAPALTALVDRIEIGGVEAQVRTVTIFQADGDRSVMTISSAPAR